MTDRYLYEITAELLKRPLGENQIWNVNFPGCTLKECKGVLYDRTVSTSEFYLDRYHETPVGEGRISYMVEGIRKWDAEPGTDLRAVLDQYVSVGIVHNYS